MVLLAQSTTEDYISAAEGGGGEKREDKDSKHAYYTVTRNEYYTFIYAKLSLTLLTDSNNLTSVVHLNRHPNNPKGVHVYPGEKKNAKNETLHA